MADLLFKVSPNIVLCSISCTYWQCDCGTDIEGGNDSQFDVAWRENG